MRNLLFIITLIGTVACGQIQSVETTTTVVITIAVTPSSLHTSWPLPTHPAPLPTTTQTLILPTIHPTATSHPTVIPSPTPDFTCPQVGAASTFAQPLNAGELKEHILAYLNMGGQWDSLAVLLESLQIENEIVLVDMNGDDVSEVVVNTTVLTEESPGSEVATWVFQCHEGQYDIVFQSVEYFRFYRFSIVDDLDNNGNSEVVIVDGFAGSACALEPTVLGWNDNSVADYSPSYLELELGCSLEDRVMLEDIDNDNSKELIVAGETIGHLSYAPPRGITQTFTLQDQTYRLVTTEYAPAEYRVHVLDDAQRALDKDDLSLAAQFYDQAAHDDSLSNIQSYHFPNLFMAEQMGFTEQDFPEEYQRSFALFRLAAIHFVLENNEEVASALVELDDNYLEGVPGHEFTVLAHTLINALAARKAPPLACQEVTELIELSYPELDIHFYWGANIAFYRNNTICPFVASE